MSLIMMAYGVDSFQVSSRASLNDPAFDIAATVPAGAAKEQFRVMLQNLVAERSSGYSSYRRSCLLTWS
jgi:uncharacterized protein (TIGR03435 family)